MKTTDKKIPFRRKKTIHEKRYDANEAPMIFWTSACFCCFYATQLRTEPLQKSMIASGMYTGMYERPFPPPTLRAMQMPATNITPISSLMMFLFRTWLRKCFRKRTEKS
jgi:hypothetical protein